MSRLQRVQSFESLLKKKISNFLSLFFWHKVQLFESFFFFSDFVSLSHIRQKSSILWVNKIFEKKSSIICGKDEKVSILCGEKEKGFNSLHHIQRKRFQFSASYSKKKVLILWDILRKTKSSILWAILWVFFLTHGSNVQFFESYFKSSIHCVFFVWNIQFLESFISRNKSSFLCVK